MSVSASRLKIVALALVAAAVSGSAFAKKPTLMPAWYNGRTVFFIVTNHNVFGFDNTAHEEKVAIPLYSFGPRANPLQADVLSAIPGVPGYRPWWEIFDVTVIGTRDLSTNPFTSEAEVLAAAASNEVVITETNFVFLCQVIKR